LLTDFRLQHDPTSGCARDYRVYIEYLRMDVVIGQIRQFKRGLPWSFRFFRSDRGQGADSMEEALDKILENASKIMESDPKRFHQLVDWT
jgi:hypothetical protein